MRVHMHLCRCICALACVYNVYVPLHVCVCAFVSLHICAVAHLCTCAIVHVCRRKCAFACVCGCMTVVVVGDLLFCYLSYDLERKKVKMRIFDLFHKSFSSNGNRERETVFKEKETIEITD